MSSDSRRPLGKKTVTSGASSVTNYNALFVVSDQQQQQQQVPSLSPSSISTPTVIPSRTASLSRDQMRSAYAETDGLISTPRHGVSSPHNHHHHQQQQQINIAEIFAQQQQQAKISKFEGGSPLTDDQASSRNSPQTSNQTPAFSLFNVDTSSLQIVLEQLAQGHNNHMHQISNLQNELSSLRFLATKTKEESFNSLAALSSRQDNQFKYLRTILGDDMEEHSPIAPSTPRISPTSSSSNHPLSQLISTNEQKKPMASAVASTQPAHQSSNTSNSNNDQQQQQALSPYQNLPHVFRTSFDFIRKEFKQQIEKQSEKLSKQIEESIAKAVKQVMENTESKIKSTSDPLRESLEFKTSAISKMMSERMSELMQTMARGFEKSETAEITLRTNLQSVTTLAQRIEKRFNERMDHADDRATSMETAFSNHLVQFDDLAHRITPLIGGTEMDEAVGNMMTRSGYFPANHSSSSSSALSPPRRVVDHSSISSLLRQHQQQQSSSTRTTTHERTTTFAEDTGCEKQSSEEKPPHIDDDFASTSSMRISPRRKSQAPIMLNEDEFEKSLELGAESNPGMAMGHSSSKNNNNNNNRGHHHRSVHNDDNSVIPSSIVGSIDVEVLASHDARAIAMLHTAPFVALRHQVLQDTKIRVAATRDAIMSELDNYLLEMREEIVRRPLPQRIVEMIRDMTSDRQVPEQLAEIRVHLQALETGKIGHKIFNEALKQKSDISLIEGKAEKDVVNAQLQNVQAKLEFLREDLIAVQTERNQFRNMLREVLYMHRRAQALSSGGGQQSSTASSALENGFSMQFVENDDHHSSFPSPSTRSGEAASSPNQGQRFANSQSIGGIHNNVNDMERSLRVRDPRLPAVQQKDAYEIHDDDPRLKIPNTGHIDKRTSTGISNNNNNNNSGSYHRPPPTAPTGASPRSSNRNGATAAGNSSVKRPAQKMVDDILQGESSSPKTAGSFRRTTTGTRNSLQQSSSPSSNTTGGGGGGGFLPDLSQVGSRDMTQKSQRKVYTPTDERADPPMN